MPPPGRARLDDADIDFDTYTVDGAARLLDHQQNACFVAAVRAKARAKLVGYGMLTEITRCLRLGIGSPAGLNMSIRLRFVKSIILTRAIQIADI